MKITKKELKLRVPQNKYLPSIEEEIKENLKRMGVNGLSIDLRFDARQNVALLRFTFNVKNYEVRISNQSDIRANMYAICKRVEYKARMHLLDIEPFDISMSPYLQLENKSDYQSQEFEMPKASIKSYVILGIPEYSSNEEIVKRYKTLCKTFHPDMSLSKEAKIEFEKRFKEIGDAYKELCKERGI